MIGGFLCFYLLLMLLVLPLLGHWILRPFTEAVRMLRAPTRFLLSDFIWLMVLLQASFAAARLTLSLDQTEVFVGILVFLCLATVAIWAGAISALSRGGIRQARRRAVFVLVVLPAILGLMVVVAVGLMTVVMLLIERPRSMHPAWSVAIPVGYVAGVALLSWALRRVTRWVAAGAASLGETAGNDVKR